MVLTILSSICGGTGSQRERQHPPDGASGDTRGSQQDNGAVPKKGLSYLDSSARTDVQDFHPTYQNTTCKRAG